MLNVYGIALFVKPDVPEIPHMMRGRGNEILQGNKALKTADLVYFRYRQSGMFFYQDQ